MSSRSAWNGRSVGLSVCLSLCLCLCLPICLSVCLCLSVFLSVSVCLSVCLSVSLRLSVCLCHSLSLSLLIWREKKSLEVSSEGVQRRLQRERHNNTQRTRKDKSLGRRRWTDLTVQPQSEEHEEEENWPQLRREHVRQSLRVRDERQAVTCGHRGQCNGQARTVKNNNPSSSTSQSFIVTKTTSTAAVVAAAAAHHNHNYRIVPRVFFSFLCLWRFQHANVKIVLWLNDTIIDGQVIIRESLCDGKFIWIN